MNLRKNLIIVKNKDETSNISSIKKIDREYHVVFNSSDRVWPYNKRSVKWYKNPKEIHIDNIKIFYNETELYDIESLLEFEEHYLVSYRRIGLKSYRKNEISIIHSAVKSSESKNLISYYKLIAEKISLRSDDGKSLLANKFKNMKFIDPSSCLGNYINPNKDIERRDVSDVIYPFGCNLSQKQAVRNALENKISVIEGPPGTGKTQTILNIIANVIKDNKTVAVVSNNNSATQNVLEKISKHNLDFLAAFLGSSENKNRFIDNQPYEIPPLADFSEEEILAFQEDINDKSEEIDEMLELQNTLALNKQKLSEYKLEEKYFKKYFNENIGEDELVTINDRATSKQILKLWIHVERISSKADRIKMNFFEKILNWIKFSRVGVYLLNKDYDLIISILQYHYYSKAIKELELEINSGEDLFKKFNFHKNLEDITNISMEVLKGKISLKYKNKIRKKFTKDDLWKNSAKILNDYPLILSTTFSINSSLNSSTIYDYLIVDEASQVDLVTGSLALSCARNIVVVGDLMQLPNVIKDDDKLKIHAISEEFNINQNYRYENHSLLSSIISTFPNVNRTLLKEHYRCHPKIIQFCNKKFYNDQLIIMTKDLEENDVLKVYKTVKGSHARGRINQRQVDEMITRIIPDLGSDIDTNNLGVISPYRDQCGVIKKDIDNDSLEVDTVHKYQGREKDFIIISTVDNKISDFVDNPNMLNVALSRAKKKLCLLVSDNEENMKSNIGDLIRYINHNNFEILEGEVYSIFDLLYKEYASDKKKYLKDADKISEYDSENLMYKLLLDILEDYNELDIFYNYPLRMLISDNDKLDEVEKAYKNHRNTHVDFLIYRKIDKSVVLVIEVDGYDFHKAGSIQSERDRMKDRILDKYNIRYLRLKTNGSYEKIKIYNELEKIV